MAGEKENGIKRLDYRFQSIKIKISLTVGFRMQFLCLGN